MDFSFFTTDNKSGYKTNEKWLEKNQPELYNKIISYSNSTQPDINFKEKIYFYFHNLTERPKCLKCDAEVKFRNRFDKPYGDFCSLTCANNNKEELIKRQKETLNKKYGVDFYPQHKEFISKQKKTKLLNYGNENYNNTEKNKKTRLEKYGNENYNNIEKQKQTCLVKYGEDNYSKSNNYQNKITKKFKELYPDILFNEIKKNSVIIDCQKCGTSCELTKQLLYERYKRKYDVCLNCNPLGFKQRSGYEDELSNFLDQLNVKYLTNYKLPETKLEIDIFIPDHNLGIEFNGLYWHNELFKTPTYHLEKTNKCNENGISLIHIFEDEWVYNCEIVKSVIKNKLNISSGSIYARKCIIKEVNSLISKKFLEGNHIQGNVNSKVRLGLFYNDELISLMTFSKGRIIMGGKKDEWELNRFCNKLNTNVVGAASKLLSFFIKNYNPNKIISYSDARIFDGQMYGKLNFKRISQSKPNYWYVIGNKRHYRFNFNKSNLIKEGYNPNKTEKEIMFERKIYRIYDCGNVRWELTID
jgi:hypothetical protein